jgi:hypothetical protein
VNAADAPATPVLPDVCHDRGMEFAPNPAALWLAHPVSGTNETAAGRIVGWDTSGGRPVPVVAFTDDDGRLDTIGTPPTDAVWLGESREEVLESVRRRNR